MAVPKRLRRPISRLLFPLVLLLIAASTSTAAGSPLTWQNRTSTRLRNSLLAVAYGNGVYVAVANEPFIFTSPDGVDWAVKPMDDRKLALSGVTYGNGRFVAVGAGGAIYTSDNGFGWAFRPSDSRAMLNDVAYCNGIYVAVGDAGTILTSTDGVAWAPRVPISAHSLEAVTCGGGRLVAVGMGGTVAVSVDGIQWETQTWGGTEKPYLTAVAYGPAGFVAGGWAGSKGTLITSADGLRWAAAAVSPKYVISALAYGQGQYLAAGVGDQFTPVMLTSSDGKSWSQMSSDALRDWRAQAGGINAIESIAYGPPGFVAVGTGGAIFQAVDPAWPAPPDATGHGLRSLAYGNGRYAAVDVGGRLLTATDPARWSTYRSSQEPAPRLWGVTFHNGFFAAVGDAGSLLLSRDSGATWALQDAGTKAALYAVTSGNGSIVAAGESGTIVSSADGSTWRKYLSPSRTAFVSAAFAGGKFVLTGSDGTVVTSANGTDWLEAGSLAVAAPAGPISDADAARVTRIAIRNATKESAPLTLQSGAPYRFEATGYDAAGNLVGPVGAVWSVVYRQSTRETPIMGPDGGLAPLATVDAGGAFVAQGAGTVTLRAAFRNLLVDADLKIVPDETDRGPRVAPPVLPARFTDFAIMLEPYRIPTAQIKVGVPTRMAAYGTYGDRISSEAVHPYWYIAYHPTAWGAPKATVDADGIITAYEPGQFLVGGTFANHSWGMTIEAIR